MNTVPPGDETGVSVRRKITSADYYKPYQHYKEHGIDRPKSSHKDVSPAEKFVFKIQVPNGKKLLWDFTASGELQFAIFRGNVSFYIELLLYSNHTVPLQYSYSESTGNLP